MRKLQSPQPLPKRPSSCFSSTWGQTLVPRRLQGSEDSPLPSPPWFWVRLRWDELERKTLSVPLSEFYAFLHFPVITYTYVQRRKWPGKMDSLSFVVLPATEEDRVLVAEKAPSLSLLIRLCYGSELGKHFRNWFNSCLWNCFCQAAHDYQHHEEIPCLTPGHRAISVTGPRLEFSGSKAFSDIILFLATRYELEEIQNSYFLMLALSFKTLFQHSLC